MSDSIVKDKSLKFAVRIVKLSQILKEDRKEYIRHYVNLIFCNYLIINKLKILFF